MPGASLVDRIPVAGGGVELALSGVVGFRVWGLGCWVSGFGFRVPGF